MSLFSLDDNSKKFIADTNTMALKIILSTYWDKNDSFEDHIHHKNGTEDSYYKEETLFLFEKSNSNCYVLLCCNFI